MSLRYFASAILAAILLLPACGRKGDLIIPGTVLPEAPAGLSAEPRDGAMILVFTMPDKDSSGGPLTDLGGFAVMRAEVPEDKGECPCRFEKVGYIDLEAARGSALVEGRRVVWPDKGPGLVFGKRYIYRVAGVNKDGYAGAESESAQARLLVPPAVPAGLAARPGNGSVTLDWPSVGKDEGGNEVRDLAGYNLYRLSKPDEKPARPVNGLPIPAQPYTDSGLTNGVTYFYRLTALRGMEPPFTEGGPAAAVQATPADREAPSAPAGVRAVPSEGVTLLSWEPNPEPDIKGYKVYRQGPEDNAILPLTPSPINKVTYKDASVKPGGAYSYAVTAVDDAEPPNESAPSEKVAVTIP